MRNKAFLILIASLCMVIAGLTLVNPEHVFAFKPSLDLTNGTSSQQVPLQQTTQIPMGVQPKNNTATGGGGGFSFSSNFTALTQATGTSQPSNRLLSENITVEPSLVTHTSSFLDYENSTFGMRIEYPSNWTKYESQNGSSELIVQFTDRPFNENNNFTMRASEGGLAIKGVPFTTNSSTTDLSLWTQVQLNLLMTSLPSFKLDEMKSMLLNSRQQNIPATMTSYTYRDPLGKELNAFLVDLFKDGRAYSLEYSDEPEVYSKNLPVLLEMIDSFEIFESPQTTMVIPASTRFSQYENGTMGIKMEYPDNWMYKEEGDGVTFIFPGGFFYAKKTPASDRARVDSTSEEESTIFVNDVRQAFSGFSLIQAEPTKLPSANFTSSNLVIYTGSTEIGKLSKYMDIITVYNGDLYWIEYSADLNAYEMFEPTIQKMIDSFQISSEPDAAGSSAPTPELHDNNFGLDKTESISLENGTTHPIKYKITDGQVTGMSLNRTSDGKPSLIIDIVHEAREADYGRLQLEIPNVVLDPNRKLMVFDGLGPAEWKELERDPRAVILEAAFYIYSSLEPTTIEIVGLG